MFGKVYASLFRGSLRGRPNEILVFVNMIATCDPEGVVDKTEQTISDEIGIPVEKVLESIAYLSKPDPRSRRTEEEGRRIVLIDESRGWGWKIVNYEYYRTLTNTDRRRWQNRIYQQRFKQKIREQKQPQPVPQSSKQESAPVSSGKEPVSITKDEVSNGRHKQKQKQKQKNGDLEPNLTSPPIEQDKPAEPDLKKPEATAEPNQPAPRQVFIEGWCEAYKTRFNATYAFDGGRDAKAASELIQMKHDPIALIDIAQRAWQLPGFLGQKSMSIHSFRSFINEIQGQLVQGSKPITPSVKCVLDQRALDRIETEMNRIKSGYSEHMPISKEDLQKLKTLRSRAQELKEQLGLIV